MELVEPAGAAVCSGGGAAGQGGRNRRSGAPCAQASGGGSGWNNGTAYTTFAAWQYGSGLDTHGSYQTSSPVNSDGTIPSGASAVVGAGTNLTSLGITALDCDTTAGNTRTCTARSAMGAWTVSAYTYGGAVPPGAPHGLRVLSIQ